MRTTIEKIGLTGWVLRCPLHGLIANENDRSLIEDMQRRHNQRCTNEKKPDQE
ncbi:hypothetical protein J2T22_001650 [Pseudarthrobacter defluvii]|uniref:Uncharacterized protein n=1 Tax=Pseudarthrobacter defluvii TaxID=410837 RepID=A0ABT9UFQ0_9MICC|nr:hypothetical protein [Pseudarthrobacter defluvii]